MWIVGIWTSYCQEYIDGIARWVAVTLNTVTRLSMDQHANYPAIIVKDIANEIVRKVTFYYFLMI